MSDPFLYDQRIEVIRMADSPCSSTNRIFRDVQGRRQVPVSCQYQRATWSLSKSDCAAIGTTQFAVIRMLSLARERGLPALLDLLNRIPASEAQWWVKLDISSPLAWQVVQELGFVLNYVSLQDRLPTVFMPVSPPPYPSMGTGGLSVVGHRGTLPPC